MWRELHPSVELEETTRTKQEHSCASRPSRLAQSRRWLPTSEGVCLAFAEVQKQSCNRNATCHVQKRRIEPPIVWKCACHARSPHTFGANPLRLQKEPPAALAVPWRELCLYIHVPPPHKRAQHPRFMAKRHGRSTSDPPFLPPMFVPSTRSPRSPRRCMESFSTVPFRCLLGNNPTRAVGRAEGASATKCTWLRGGLRHVSKGVRLARHERG